MKCETCMQEMKQVGSHYVKGHKIGLPERILSYLCPCGIREQHLRVKVSDVLKLKHSHEAQRQAWIRERARLLGQINDLTISESDRKRFEKLSEADIFLEFLRQLDKTLRATLRSAKNKDA